MFHVTFGAGPFLDKLGCYEPYVMALGLVGSDKNICFMFSISINPYKPAGTSFGHCDTFWTDWVEDH